MIEDELPIEVTLPYTYDHVPTLKELMPSTAGLPGVKYMQVCTINVKPAEDQGWGPVSDARFYTIIGPKGQSHMMLASQGTPTPGASPGDGARRMYLDDDVYKLTGLWRGYYPKSLQEEFKLDELGKSLSERAPQAPVLDSGKDSDKEAFRHVPTSLEDAIASQS